MVTKRLLTAHSDLDHTYKWRGSTAGCRRHVTQHAGTNGGPPLLVKHLLDDFL
jgi:hypothetical protein